jgi:hypothetical protein
VKALGASGEDLLDHGRIDHVGHVAEVREPYAEDLAVAAVKPDEEADRIARVPDALRDAGQTRAGRPARAGLGWAVP